MSHARLKKFVPPQILQNTQSPPLTPSIDVKNTCPLSSIKLYKVT